VTRTAQNEVVLELDRDYPCYYLAQKLCEQRIQDGLRKVKRHYMLEQAGVDQRGWFTFQACKLLSWLGCLMVAVGRRLERHAMPPVAPSAWLPRASGA